MDRREKHRIYMQGWREKNRERHNELARESHQRNKHKHVGKFREYHLQRTYGISQDDFVVLLSAQGDACKICRRPQSDSKRSFHVDHDHETGEIRGILCNRCNTSLGWYEKHKSSIDSYI